MTNSFSDQRRWAGDDEALDQCFHSAVLSLRRLTSRTAVAVSQSGRVVPVDQTTAKAIASLVGVKPLADHAMTAWRSAVCAEPSVLIDVMTKMVNDGLLVPSASIGAPSHQPERPGIGCVAIVTADRPRHLRRCLAAIGANATRYGRSVRIVVVDGSVGSDNADANRNSSNQLAATTGHRVVYINKDTVRPLWGAIASAGIPAECIAFGLTPGEIGSGRNIALLYAGTGNLLMVDDDIVADVWAHPSRVEGVKFAGHGEVREWRFFRSRAAAIQAAGARAAVDLLGEHERLLGARLQALAASPGGQIDGAEACGHMIRALERQQGVVRVTMAGLVGDTARYCPQTLLLLNGSPRELLRDQATFETALRFREVHRIARAPTVTHDASCATYCVGIDTTGVVPPFMPLGRNEDGVFAATLALVDPMAFFGHLPYGVLHDSDRPSSTSAEQMLWMRETRLCEYVAASIRLAELPLQSGGPLERLGSLGEAMVACGRLSEHEFLAAMSNEIVGHKVNALSTAEQAAASELSGPSHVLRELRSSCEELGRRVAEAAFIEPVECRRGDCHPVQSAQAFICKFGEFIGAWQTIRRVAGEYIRCETTSGATNGSCHSTV